MSWRSGCSATHSSDADEAHASQLDDVDLSALGPELGLNLLEVEDPMHDALDLQMLS